MAQYTLKSIMDNGGNEIHSALTAAKNKLYSEVRSKQTNADISTLNTKLNDVFSNPNSPARQYFDKYSSQYLMAGEEVITKIFNNSTFNANTKFSQNKTYYNMGSKISVSTMIKATSQLSQLLESLNNISSAVDKNQLMIVTNKLETLKSQISNEIMKFQNTFFKGSSVNNKIITSKKVGDATLSRIGDLMNEAYAAIGFFSANMQAQGVGTVFEEALALAYLSADDYTEKLVGKLIEEQALFGRTTVKRGISSEGISYTMSFKGNEEGFDKFQKRLSKGKHTSVNNFKFDKDNLVITFNYNPSTEKFGKMDVLLKVEGKSSKEYRISAKHWSTGAGDFGHTSILSGIYRAVGTVLEAYQLALLSPGRDHMGNPDLPHPNVREAAHELAQIALKSDIIMGLNQEKGYADTIVIKTGKGIFVKDAAELVLEKSVHLSSGYHPGTLNAQANSIYNGLINQGIIQGGRTRAYLMGTTSVLQRMMVTVNYSVK